MMVVIDVMVWCKEADNKFLFGTVRREIETDLVPIAGMEIEDSAWKNPREIKRVTMNPNEGYYYLWVGEDTAHKKSSAYRQVQTYKSHGWEVLYCGTE